MARGFHGFSEDRDYDYEVRTVIGYAGARGSDPGEVIGATAGIHGKDHDAWFEAWNALAQRTAETAATCASHGHMVSACWAHLRASNYFAVAVNALSSLDRTDELLPTYQAGRAQWDAFIDASGLRVERIQIPYEDITMPGCLFRPDARDTTPLLVGVNGSDGAMPGLWAECAAGALKRGYSVLLFDGPGQQSMLFERDVPFRHDWEKVLTPVLDFAISLPGVDAGRVAVYGVSQGGYWVTRALAFEHRFAAAVVDPGVVDVSTSWTSNVPHSLLKKLDKGDAVAFDRDMALGMKLSPKTARTWNFRARPYGTTGYADTIAALREYDATEVAASITTPLLVTSSEGEQFWPGQSAQLVALTAGVSTLVEFTAAEGAALHCQPLARGLTEQRIFDWLDHQLGHAS